MNKQGEGVKHLEVLESETGGCVVVVGIDRESLMRKREERNLWIFSSAEIVQLIIQNALQGVKHP